MTISDRNSTQMSGELAQIVATKVEAGLLQSDPAQESAIVALDNLLSQLNAPALDNKKSSLGWLFSKKKIVSTDQPRGIYLWGGVGRGKSMLMDMFYELVSTTLKRRVHFHAFMQDVHKRIHNWRLAQKTAKERSADPIPPLAADLAKEVHLLCFDEFAVTDVADAMILARLFTGLFEHGVTVVATSNVVPDNLYENGLNRSFFLPFIELIKTRMVVLELDSPTDYRMEILISSDVYMTGHGSQKRFDGLWNQMTDGLQIEPVEIEVSGRQTVYDLASGGLVRTTFADLCEKPLGSGDYLALAERFHTIFLDSVPTMDESARNAIKRFINLVDTLYDRGKLLVVRASEQPSQLYSVEHGIEAFEFQRTVSRLQEMQGEEWLEKDRG